MKRGMQTHLERNMIPVDTHFQLLSPNDILLWPLVVIFPTSVSCHRIFNEPSGGGKERGN